MKTIVNEVRLYGNIEVFALFLGIAGLVALVLAQSGRGIF